MKDENYTGLNDDELEMLFQTNTTNFIAEQKKQNKETERFCKEATKIFAKLTNGYANVVKVQISLKRKMFRLNVYMIILLLLLLWSLWA